MISQIITKVDADAKFDNTINLFKKMEKSKITLQAAKIDQNNYKSNLNEMKRGKSKNKSIKQEKA